MSDAIFAAAAYSIFSTMGVAAVYQSPIVTHEGAPVNDPDNTGSLEVDTLAIFSEIPQTVEGMQDSIEDQPTISLMTKLTSATQGVYAERNGIVTIGTNLYRLTAKIEAEYDSRFETRWYVREVV